MSQLTPIQAAFEGEGKADSKEEVLAFWWTAVTRGCTSPVEEVNAPVFSDGESIMHRALRSLVEGWGDIDLILKLIKMGGSLTHPKTTKCRFGPLEACFSSGRNGTHRVDLFLDVLLQHSRHSAPPIVFGGTVFEDDAPPSRLHYPIRIASGPLDAPRTVAYPAQLNGTHDNDDTEVIVMQTEFAIDDPLRPLAELFGCQINL